MKLFTTFNFKGLILPILDNNDNLYMFIKNDCEHKVLLHITAFNINKIVYINSKSSKLVRCINFTPNIQLKIFYMGRELFDFSTNDINKDILLLYSNYILSNVTEVDNVSFSFSFLDGCKVTAISKKDQQYFIKFINRDNNKIFHEDNFKSNETYWLKTPFYINYEIIILDSSGEKVFKYYFDLTEKNVWFRFKTDNIIETMSWIPYIEMFKGIHNCKIFLTTCCNSELINRYPLFTFIPLEESEEKHKIFVSYDIYKSEQILGHEL